jgi:hypothetical protein
MAGKRVLLTLNVRIYNSLKKEAEKNLMSIQELINDVLRQKVLKKKEDYEAYSRKR